MISESIKKLFSIVSIRFLPFLSHFSFFCPLEKFDITPHCLHRDSLTLILMLIFMFNVNSFYRKDVLKLHYWAVFTKTTKKNHIISIIFHNKKLWVPDFSLSVVRFPCYSLWMQRLKLQWHSRMCSIAPELSYFPCWGYPLTSKKKKPLTSGQKRKKLTATGLEPRTT